MKLFVHIISAILLTFACYIWYFTEASFVFGAMIFLFSIFPINLYVLLTPKEEKKNSTIMQKVIGATFAIVSLGACIFILMTNKEDDFIALFKNAYFLTIFWIFVTCGIVVSHNKR